MEGTVEVDGGCRSRGRGKYLRRRTEEKRREDEGELEGRRKLRWELHVGQREGSGRKLELKARTVPWLRGQCLGDVEKNGQEPKTT
jgi:hypothetical protein